jgi:hypothetical protein
MRKMQGEERDSSPSQVSGRVLARVLAADLRSACGGLRPTPKVVTASVTDFGAQLDYTSRGSDADSV